MNPHRHRLTATFLTRVPALLLAWAPCFSFAEPEQLASAASSGGESSGGNIQLISSIAEGLVPADSTAAAGTIAHGDGFLQRAYQFDEGVGTITSTIGEGQTGPLLTGFYGVLPDGSRVLYDADELSWRILSGPLAVDAAGQGTGLSVFSDTPATWEISILNLAQQDTTTVLNTDTSNDFPLWQTHYFGSPAAPDAASMFDFDGDGNDNSTEFTAGTSPTDSTEHVRLRILPGANASERVIRFSPFLPGRTYTLLSAVSLDEAFTPLSPVSTGTDAGTGERIFTDQAATAARRFYTVRILRD